MVDNNHPVLVKLRKAGFKVSAHFRLTDDGATLEVTAHNPAAKETIHGRSKAARFEEAVSKLAFAASQAGYRGLGW